MEIRHLRYFVAVVEERSFTKASARLFIAQPPLSRQIQNLEEELGLQLLERGSRPVKTTEAGQFFYQYAKRVLTNIDQMVAMTKQVGVVDKVIKIGFVGSLLFGLLPKIIHNFRQSQPSLKIELVELTTLEQIEALKQGKIDVGFGRLKVSDPAIKRILLRNEDLSVGLHISHPLAQMQNGVYLADIVNERLLLYPNTDKQDFSDHILSIFAEHGLIPNHIQKVREVQLALGLSAAGEGICIVPRSSETIQIADLCYIPLLDPDAKSPIFMSYRNLEDSDYIAVLLQTIETVYKQVSIHNFQQRLSFFGKITHSVSDAN